MQSNLREKIFLLKEKYNLAKSLPEFLLSNDKIIIGISTHNVLQFSELYNQYQSILGYLAIGPMYSTHTKIVEYPIVKQEELYEIIGFIIKNKIDISLVFIGGIDISKIKELYSILYNFDYFKNKIVYYASISNFLTNAIPYQYP